jgi:membrane protein DedA with SNARE-associated domain
MTFGLRTILLLVAVVLFIIGVFAEEHYADILALGLAAFAGAFLADALGWADRTFGAPGDRTT